MAIALRSGVREFIAPSDRSQPQEAQTVWLLRPLDVFAAAELADSYTTEESKWASKAIQMAKLALIGWRNFKDETGAEVAFKGFSGRATDDDLRQIPFSVVLEIVAEIHQFESLSRKTAGE
jgi:hypothetical protein